VRYSDYDAYDFYFQLILRKGWRLRKETLDRNTIGPDPLLFGTLWWITADARKTGISMECMTLEKALMKRKDWARARRSERDRDLWRVK
jgi:hypothetical protein